MSSIHDRKDRIQWCMKSLPIGLLAVDYSWQVPERTRIPTHFASDCSVYRQQSDLQSRCSGTRELIHLRLDISALEHGKVQVFQLRLPFHSSGQGSFQGMNTVSMSIAS